jgi:methionine synthase / methylenetetrahydrofolate reductase(NADPH)
LLDTAVKYFNGVYLSTPFLRYEMTVQLMQYIKQLDEQNKGVQVNA